jgi:hypothetical protein
MVEEPEPPPLALPIGGTPALVGEEVAAKAAEFRVPRLRRLS